MLFLRYILVKWGYKMYRNIFLTCTLGVLAACNHNQVDHNVKPPTASNGYATETSSFDDPGVTRTTKVELQNLDWDGTGNVTQKQVSLDISATENVDEYIVTYEGIDVTINWNEVDGWFEGQTGDMYIRISPWWITDNQQAGLSWINIWDYSGVEGDSWGFAVSGYNSDPADVAARTGEVLFSGWGGISLAAVDDSFWAFADGPASLAADFDLNTISGTIELSDCGCGDYVISDTTMYLNEMEIAGNTFDGQATVTPADLGLASVGNISVDGMFYEFGATAAGGTVSGTGVAAEGFTTTLINGAFIAE